MTPALIVGSRPSWLAKLNPHLRSVGIDVRWAWETKADLKRPFPACALVLVATDCNSHTLSAGVVPAAKRAGVPVVYLSHRWSQAAPMLARHGFRPAPEATPPEPMPVPESEVMPTRRLVRLPAHAPAAPAPAPAKFTALDAARLTLLSHPEYSTEEVRKIAGCDNGTVARARRTLGIARSVGNDGAGLFVHLASWDAAGGTRETLDALRAALPRGVHTITDEVWATACARQDKTGGPLAIRSALAAAPARKGRVEQEAPAPVTVATIPASEVPAPVREAFDRQEEARVADLPADVADAIRLLHVVMQAHGFTRVEVSGTGNVVWSREVVLTRAGILSL